MTIGLIDVDNMNSKARFPNLALMKLSAYHKAKGDHVEWWSMDGQYDIVYGSQVFDFSMPPPEITNADQFIIGGCARTPERSLSGSAEHVMPDYDLYGVKEAYGFLTRGCPRNCSFCNVTQSQGKYSRIVADLSEFWTDQDTIKLMDPNMYACKDWMHLAQQLINSGAGIDFTQGVDIRVMNDEKIHSLNQMNLKMIHFAWDNYEMKTYDDLKKWRPYFKIRGRELGVYVLTNFNTTHEEDLERVMKLRELDYSPYVMIYNKDMAPKHTRHLQRWTNNRALWNTCKSFDDYGKKQDVVIDGQITLF